MKFSAVFCSLCLLASIALLAPGCGGEEAHCETDADCDDGMECHIEDGVDPHCMGMGDDDDSADMDM